MNFNYFRYFVVIIESGSLGKAAKLLHIAQTSLSECVKVLEERYEVQLLERYARGVKPTPAGRVFYEHANAILRMHSAMVEEVRGHSNLVHGIVSIGMPNSISEILATPLLVRILQDYPGIQLHIRQGLSGILEAWLNDEKIDCALLFLSEDQAQARNLHGIPVLVEEMFVACAKDRYPDTQKISLFNLKEEIFLCPGREHGLTKLVIHYAETLGVKLKTGAEVDSLSAMLGTANTGLGYTIMPGSAFHLSRHYSNLAVLRLTPLLERPLALCKTKISYVSPAVKIVQSLVLELCRDLIEKGLWIGASSI